MDVFHESPFGKFEWDSDKDAINRRKHRISFLDALEVFRDENRLDVYDDSGEGEDRFKTIGRIKVALVILVVHTDRNGSIRLISARKATKKEERDYYAQY